MNERQRLTRLVELRERVTALGRLVDRLLDAARLGAGRREPDWQDLSLAAVLAEVDAACGARAAAGGVAWRTRERVAPRTTVHSDPVRLSRLLQHLADCAIDLAGRRGVVSVALRTSGSDALCLEVEACGEQTPDADDLDLAVSGARHLAAGLGHPVDGWLMPGRGVILAVTVPRAAAALHAGGPGTSAAAGRRGVRSR